MNNHYLKNLIKSNQKRLSSAELHLSDYLLSLSANEIVTKTISEMSLESSISQTSIFNFVKKLGYSGFQDFKIQIATHSKNQVPNSNITAFSDITSEDSAMAISQKIIKFNINSLDSLLNSMDYPSLERSIKLIQKSNALHFFGQGGSSVVAYDAYHKFIRSNFHCNYISDYHIQLSYSTKLTEEDCAFIFSHTGETHETIHLAESLRKSGCSIISLTGNPTSPLVRLSDETFIIYSDESKFRTESLTSRILYLTVMDIVYTIIMYKDEESSSESLDKIRNVLKSTRD